MAYLLYNDGIQTVIALSAQFGAEELGMESSQLVAADPDGAVCGLLAVRWRFGWLARALAPSVRSCCSLVVWTGVTIYAYAFLNSVAQFFVMGAVIGIVLGGSQALSRSLFSQMIPKGQEAEYFSLYEVSERGTRWMGPLLFGLALQFTGSYRVAILSVAIFFVLGLVLLPFVNVRKAIVEAGNMPPARV